MDNIKQYQKLSDIKPSYMRLTNPLYDVSKARIELNQQELELHYSEIGWIDETTSQKAKKGGGESNVVYIDLEDDYTSCEEI